MPGAALTTALCLHCGAATAGSDYCCAGCEIVHGLLRREGLERYYDLGGGRGIPATLAERAPPDRKWVELRAASLQAAPGASQVALDVQGITCSACVWLLEEVFERTPGGVNAVVNPALGRMDLTVQPSFPLAEFVDHVERFGYRLGPALKRERAAAGGLLVRVGVCAAIAMNSMIFAIAIYAGLSEGPIYRTFLDLNFGLSIASVAVGGSVFIDSAWRALRRGVLHLDLPIAAGILLAFGGSAHAFLARSREGAYFDTLNVFIFLMLVGRWLQERVLERNRRLLLANDGVDGLLARRLEDGEVKIVPCKDLRAGDPLLVVPGDLVCVDAELAESGRFSLDWVTGESTPHELGAGACVPAGAFNAGARAIVARARTDFAASSLVDLLRVPVRRDADAARATPFWRRLARGWVAGVLAAAAGAFALWLARTGDAGRAADVATAVLVVTCPCAFGIATPLAYEMAQAGLRRAGLYVRSAGFLDRAQSVRQVVFDKTGTLTTGALRVVDESPLRALADDERAALAQMAMRSTHPKSQAVLRALGGRAVFDGEARTSEIEGQGVTLRTSAHTYYLGAPEPSTEGGDVVFRVDGVTRAALATAEDLRPDAAGEIRRLADSGHEVWILSGDTRERVAALAARAGLPGERALGDHTPQAKADWLAAHDRGDTLFIGDGINDSLAVDRATCSGTPAIDRPFMPARSDFYFVTPGLAPIGLALRVARKLARLTRRNLRGALVYNAGAIALAYLGLMSPLVCAVVMPASSITVVLATAASLRAGSPIWKS